MEKFMEEQYKKIYGKAGKKKRKAGGRHQHRFIPSAGVAHHRSRRARIPALLHQARHDLRQGPNPHELTWALGAADNVFELCERLRDLSFLVGVRPPNPPGNHVSSVPDSEPRCQDEKRRAYRYFHALSRESFNRAHVPTGKYSLRK